jgi:hypothetical protein
MKFRRINVEGDYTMRTLSRMATASVLAIGLVSMPVSGQSGSRGIIVKRRQNGKTDGLRIQISKYDGSQPVFVDPSVPFRTGDEIRLSFTSNFNGYVYVLNLRPNGQKRLLFPYRTAGDTKTNNAVRAGHPYYWPESDLFEFDRETGTEVLQFLISHDPIPFLDAAATAPNGDLGDSESSAANQIHERASKQHLSGPQDSNGSGIVTDNVVPPDGVQTRDIRRVSVAHSPASSASPRRRQRNEEKASVVAIADDSARGRRLKSGELAVFELRLKHF